MAYAVPKLKNFSPKTLEKAAKELLAALETEANDLVTEAGEPLVSPSEKNLALKHFRDHWMARKSGVLTEVNDFAAFSTQRRKEGSRTVG